MSPESPIPAPRCDGLDDFQSLLQKVRAGEQESCTLLYNRYADAVLRVVRRHLRHQLRSTFDSFDVTQNVWKSFFLNILPKQRFESPAHLVAFLKRTAFNKVLKTERDHIETRKRSLAREVSLETCSPAQAAWEVKAADPSRQVATEDEWQHLLNGFSALEQLVLRLLRAGFGVGEVAHKTSKSERSVYRILKAFRERYAATSGNPQPQRPSTLAAEQGVDISLRLG